MKNRNLIGAIGFTILIMVAACGTLDLSGPAGKTILSSIAKNASNATNATNITSNSTNASAGNLSDLWKWGGLPAGYTMANNQIVPGSSVESDNESVMETPSQLVPDNNPNTGLGGMLVRPK